MTEYTQVTAFCPGHISGYFRPYITGNSLTSGSIGAGVVIDSGVVVTATTAEKTTVQILQQGPSNSLILIAKDSPVIRDLLDDLHVTADVKTRCHLPLSSGYGLSAAALLATVHAINALMDLRLSEEECANRAHAIEVKHRTGLGDVSACQGGGWVVRKAPGPQANIVRIYDDHTLYALTLRPISTSPVLSSPAKMSQILGSFPPDIPDNPIDIMRNSRRFAEASGLISDEIRKVLFACDANDIPASMTMLGEGVFAIGIAAGPVLSQFGTAYPLHPAKTGPYILECR